MKPRNALRRQGMMATDADNDVPGVAKLLDCIQTYRREMPDPSPLDVAAAATEVEGIAVQGQRPIKIVIEGQQPVVALHRWHPGVPAHDSWGCRVIGHGWSGTCSDGSLQPRQVEDTLVSVKWFGPTRTSKSVAPRNELRARVLVIPTIARGSIKDLNERIFFTVGAEEETGNQGE